MRTQHSARSRRRAVDTLFGNRDFRLVFAAASVSQLGAQISYLAIPVVAVSVLHATSAQVGILATLSTIAFLVIGLPAGVWVDRLRRRPVMITADLARTVLLGSVPLTWWLGGLSLIQLYAVVLLAGVCTVFFDVASQSFLPHVVTRARLTDANSALISMNAVGDVSGRSIGGLLVQTLTAPAAIILDAASYLWSAACVWRIRRFEPAAEHGHATHLGREMREGLRFVLGHPLLRAIAAKGALNNVSSQLTVTLLPVLFVRELRLPVGFLGAYLAVGGVGVFIGARCATRIGRRLGHGRAPWILGAALAPANLLLPLIGRGPWLWAAAAAWLLSAFQIGIDNVLLVSFRQRVTPDRLLGRMNATMRFLLHGALALGSALAGLLGEVAGVRAALWVSAVGLALTWLPIFFSPLRRMRDLPA
jgi:predicted MFS family arabinose efflux permease